MNKLKELLTELERELKDRLHSKHGGALHDVKRFNSYDDFYWLIEEAENDYDYCVGEMEEINGVQSDDFEDYSERAHEAKIDFQNEVKELIRTLDFSALKAKADNL